jgi:uncharacterized protein (DUF983 family)
MNTPDERPLPATLPGSYPDAAMRGMRGRCPRCGGAELFRRWLKSVETCRCCGQDWSLQQADDFPPYVAIFITGHLMAPVIILLAFDLALPLWASFAIVLPMAAAMMLAILQPAKGAIIALQWWLGMVGFTKERPPGPDPEASP